MMSILATLPTSMGGLEGAVVYIDTESAFSAERWEILLFFIIIFVIYIQHVTFTNKLTFFIFENTEC